MKTPDALQVTTARPIWRRLALALVGAELVYLLVANGLLLTPLPERWVNTGEHRRVQVTWSGAWTVVPGRFHGSSVVVSGRSRLRPWSVDLSSVTARVGVLPLVRRRLVLGGTVGDVEVRVGAEGAERPRPRKAPSGWGLVLDDVVADGALRLVVAGKGVGEEVVAAVEGHLEGRMESRFRQWVEVPSVRLRGTGSVRRDGVSLMEPFVIDGSGALARFEPRGGGAVDTLEAFSGEVEVGGTVRESGALGVRLPEGVSIVRGGEVRATLDIDKGRLGPGTMLDLADSQARAELLGFRADGAARARYRVEQGGKEDGDATVGSWDVELEKVELRRDPAAPPDVVGSLRVESTERDPHLFRKPEGMTTVFDLENASIPDVGVLADLIPPNMGVVFQEGQARLRSRFTVSPEWAVSGTMRVEISDLVAVLLGNQVRGTLDLGFDLQNGDPQARSFDLANAELSFREGRLRDVHSSGGRAQRDEPEAPWSLSGTIPEGKVRFGSPLFLSASTEVRMTDLRPVVAFLAHRSKRPWLLSHLAKIEDVAAVAQVDLDDRALRLTDAALTSDQVDVRGRLRVSGGKVEGRALLERGRLAVGVAVSGDERDWKLVKARSWYGAGASGDKR